MNLTFDTVPSGLTLYLDGIAHTTPFVYDDLVGFNHTIEARNQTVGSTAYTFSSWSDGGAQLHNIVVPNTDAAYTARLHRHRTSPPAFVQGALSKSRRVTTDPVTFPQANTSGNLIVGVRDVEQRGAATVTDSNGNTYVAGDRSGRPGDRVGVRRPSTRRTSPAGSNTVTATFVTGITSFGIVYIHEYSGLDPTNPLDVTSSAIGTTAAMSSGTAVTTHANDLLFGAGASNNIVTAGGSWLRGPIDRFGQPDRGPRRDRRRVRTPPPRRRTPNALGHAARGIQGRALERGRVNAPAV